MGFKKHYSAKFLGIAFIGIHVPLLGLVTWLTLRPLGSLNGLTILAITLVLTLVATGITLFLLNQLIAPIHLTHQALRQYLTTQTLPQLPDQYHDEVGTLMRDVDYSLHTLDQLIQEKKDLIYLFSHNLRSPSITVLSLTHLLQNRLGAEQRREREFTEQIERTMHGLLSTMDSLLMLLRLGEMQDQALTLEPLQLTSLLEETITELQPQWSSKQLTVDLQLAAQEVQSQRGLLNQILQNLVQNAIKFSPRAGTIRVHSERQGAQVIVSISDQGIGFAPELAEALFMKFTPHGRKGTAQEKSNGIGLYLCRQLAAKMRAEIRAHSPGEGKGATFELVLPAASA